MSSPERSLPVLLCLSHLRWDFVFQRPQHLMSRATATFRVVVFEEPLAAASGGPRLQTRMAPEGVLVATPMLPAGLDPEAADAAQRSLLDGLLAELAAPLAVAWYYTPMALPVAGHLRPAVTVFDSMDELSAFRGASPRLLLLERRLLRQADLVFTGGRSLHEAKRRLHSQVHLFPSSVDVSHFGAARADPPLAEPADQQGIAAPRIGFFGVVDERMDLDLLAGVAARRPDWQVVMLGPIAKIDPAILPRGPNLHWLGMKSYAELPAYLAGWNAGFMPFALNEATRFISPTKTPEFLAAGTPVVSTSVPDVVSDWGGKDGLVTVADGPEAVVAALEAVLARPRQPWLSRVDRRLDRLSWSSTWAQMRSLIEDAASGIPSRPAASAEAPERA
ncbi:MAG: glycosyltransferase [Janthinobacterium lividum]